MKWVVKLLARTVCVILVLPVVLVYQCSRLLLGTRRAFQGASQRMSRPAGVCGDYLRQAFYALTLDRCAWDVCISFGTIFSDPRARIGRGTYIGAYCCLGWVDLGERVLLASGVHVPSGAGQHRFDDPDASIKDQGGQLQCVRIGADAWIGERGVVMADVGRGCVIGAASVVTRPIEDDAVAVGSPARVIRKREPS